MPRRRRGICITFNLQLYTFNLFIILWYNKRIMMYDNFYPGRYSNWPGTESFFGPGWFLGMSLLGGLFILVVLVSLALKGFALWYAAKRNEKWWFIALLLINTLGILELIYLIFFAKVLFKKNHSHNHSHNHNHEEKSGE